MKVIGAKLEFLFLKFLSNVYRKTFEKVLA